MKNKKEEKKFHFCQQLLTASPPSGHDAKCDKIVTKVSGWIPLGAGHVMRMNVTCRNIRNQNTVKQRRVTEM